MLKVPLVKGGQELFKVPLVKGDLGGSRLGKKRLESAIEIASTHTKSACPD